MNILEYCVYGFIAFSVFGLLGYWLFHSRAHITTRIFASATIITIMTGLLWFVKVKDSPMIAQVCFGVFITLLYFSILTYIRENREEFDKE